jgi:hypothetical protein
MTLVGKLLGSVTVLFGVMVLALPVSILVQNFTEQMESDED